MKRPTCGICEKNEALIFYAGVYMCGHCLINAKEQFDKKRLQEIKEANGI